MQGSGYFNFIFFTLILHLIQTPSASHPDSQKKINPEARALWFTRYEYTSEPAIRQTIQKAKEANINLVLFQVRGQADAYYFSSYEPWSERLGGKYPGFDPLAVAIDEAHRNGIELHAWLNVFPIWSGATKPVSPAHIYNTHPEWIMVNSSGVPMNPSATGYAFGSPGIPAYIDHLFNVFMEVVEKYDIDGLHMDYIRFPSNNYSYDSISITRFKQKTGLTGPSADLAQWAQWRRDQVSNFVYKVYDGVMTRKPWVKVSAAVWGDYYDGFSDKLQDPRIWLKNSKIDFTTPMIYENNMGTYQSRLNNHARSSWGRHVYGGIGANASQNFPLTCDEILQQIEINRQLLSNGNVIFSATSLKQELIQALKNSTYEAEIPAPAMSWKVVPLISHAPLKDTEDITNPYPVVAAIESSDPLLTDSLLVVWSRSSRFEDAIVEPLSLLINNTYQAFIPPQNNQTIYYFLSAKNSTNYIAHLPRWAPTNFFSFYVGPDQIKPTISYHQEILNSFLPIDTLRFDMQVTDNTEVDNRTVFAHYSWTSGTIDSVQLHPDKTAYHYTGETICGAALGDTIFYYFSAHDRSSQKNRAESDIFAMPIGVENFEGPLAGWKNDNGWQVSTEESRGGKYAIRFSPQSNFSASSKSSFQTRESLNLENSASAVLHFWTKFSLNEDLVVGYVDVSKDNGIHWTPIGPALTGYATKWTEFYFSLSEYCGRDKPDIMIRFRAQSILDPGQDQIEWFIDDVAITCEPAAISSRDGVQTRPNTFTLYQNYPNPFNSSTVIQYEINSAKPMSIELAVLNLQGQRVAKLLSRRQKPGKYSVTWKGMDERGLHLPSGVYFYQFRSSESRVVRKMTIIR